MGSSLPTGTAPLKKMSEGKEESAASVRHTIAQIVSFVILKKVEQYRQDAQAMVESVPSAFQKFYTLTEKQAWVEVWKKNSQITPFNNCNYDYFELAISEKESSSAEIKLFMQNKYEKAKLTEQAVGKWFLDRDFVISQDWYDQNEHCVDLVTRDQFLGEITELLSGCQRDTERIASLDFFKKCLENVFDSVSK